MPSTIACPSCGLTGQVPDGFADPQVNCPRCGVVVPVNGTAPANGPAPADARTQVLDAFFAQAFGPRTVSGPPPGPVPMPLPARPSLSTPPSDASAEQQWLKEERQRLEDYLSKQFGQLQHRREELAAWQSRIEAALIAREQELNRQQKQQAAQEETLALRESAAATVAGELQELEAKAARLREEIASHQALADSNRSEAEQLVQSAAAARAEIQNLQQLAATHDTRLAEWRQRVQQLERRQVALERAEQAMQRRSAEWDDLEEQVRRELEKREQDLARDRHLVEENWGQLQSAIGEKDVLRRKLGRLSAELEHLRAASRGA